MIVLLTAGCAGELGKGSQKPGDVDIKGYVWGDTSAGGDAGFGGDAGSAGDPTPGDHYDPCTPNPSPLSVDIDVKEVAGVGTDWVDNGFPIQVVVPVPFGTMRQLPNFELRDPGGELVPVQVSALERWPRSRGCDVPHLSPYVRNLLVRFSAEVDAFTGGTSGTSTYTFGQGSATVEPDHPVVVTEIQTDVIEVGHTLHRLTFDNRDGLMISSSTGSTVDIEHVRLNNEIVKPLQRRDISVDVVERGKLMTLIHAYAEAHLVNASDPIEAIEPGFDLWFYIYADTNYVKVDYQLTNSAFNSVYSGPLYFRRHSLVIDTHSAATESILRADRFRGDSTGLDSPHVAANSLHATERYFYERWPNEIGSHTDGRIELAIFPEYSGAGQFYRDKSTDSNKIKEGVYWLDDMRSFVTEAGLHFGALSGPEADAFQATVQFPPVATLDLEPYRRARHSVGLGGYIPLEKRPNESNKRRPTCSNDTMKCRTNPDSKYYTFGKSFGYPDQFGRLLDSRQSGDAPDYSNRFLFSGDPAEFYVLEQLALYGYISTLPQHIPASYKASEHWSTLDLSDAPYGGGTWRKFIDNNTKELAFDYIAGTMKIADAEDDPHHWSEYALISYWSLTGNPLVAQYYRGVAEFRRPYMEDAADYQSNAQRGIAHRICNTVSAARVTADPELPGLIRDYLYDTLHPRIHSSGVMGNDDTSVAPFQMGYLSRCIIDYASFTGDHGDEVLDLVGGMVRANFEHLQFGYYQKLGSMAAGAPSSGSSYVMVDPQIAWACWIGKDPAEVGTAGAMAAQAIEFGESGLNGGRRAYNSGDLRSWRGNVGAYSTMVYAGSPEGNCIAEGFDPFAIEPRRAVD